MKIKVFYPNEKGNIELTKEKLEAILTEAYNEGYHDGRYNGGYCYGGLASTTLLGDNLTVTTPYITSRTNVSGDLVSTGSSQIGKVSTIDCYDSTAIAANCCAVKADILKADALKTEAKSAITVEYGEVTNAH